MKDRKNFGEYIAQKRKVLSMTQEDLAQKLYVNATTISKWERGITYPDITMIPLLCKELGISEHEFFTACDDSSMSEKERKAQKYERMVKGLEYFFLISYAIALITCLICNLALDHTLSWFFIVLVSIMISFALTNLPVLLQRRKEKHITVKCMGLITVLVYVLLWVCNLYTNGTWFVTVALPVTTFEMGLVWIGILVLLYTKTNRWIKTGVILFLVTLSEVCSNPLLDYLLPGEATTDNTINMVVGLILVILTIFFLVLGICQASQKKK